MEVNGNTTEEKKPFRSGYLNALSGKFRKASAKNGMHKEVMQLAQKNYKGEMLQNITAEQNRKHAEETDLILQEIDTLAMQELERLETKKKSGRTETGEDELDIITRLDKTADILTRDELQSIADTYKDSDLVQRKLRKVAEDRELYIDTYPGFDKKISTVRQTAADTKSFIHSSDFGLTSEIYFSTYLNEADDILCPVERETESAYTSAAAQEDDTAEQEADDHDNP